MTNNYYAYVRVSTVRQSIQGVSLSEQHRSIDRYANDHGIQVVQWFEEVESATKGCRTVFKELMRQLKQKKGRVGLLIHKIDRGARNLRDWADIGDLIDRGIDVRFTNDDLDLESRAGRLTADIQAVIAADYIRNLKEEVKKGISGRLHQGIYPFRASYGYCARGRGHMKIPHVM
ncbi:MAG: recombinase family protein [Candidatus Thiodiazotropha sp.]